MRRALLLLALPICTVIGCVDQLPTDGTRSGDAIMPLADGNRWIGRLNGTTDRGLTWMVLDDDTLEVVGSSRIDGEEWFALQLDGMIAGDYTNRDDGLYTTNSGCTCLRAKYPGDAGDLFTIDSAMVLLPDPLGGTATPVMMRFAVEIVSTDTVVTVPAGTFTCHLYHRVLLDDPNARFVDEIYEFYAPDIGPIRTDIYTTGLPKNGDAPDRRWELVEYDVQ